MRTIISFIAASMLAAASSTVWAEAAPAEPAKTDTPATSVAPDKSAEAVRPATQTIVVKPRESGVDQPLCTGE
ncbi:MAG TPA: hypothetical protein VFQ98_05385 [Gallionella sp.]|nr:hypothetical protein [Gallionella sp.]